jgi:pyridoxine 5'-phosphate synthase PdxJ
MTQPDIGERIMPANYDNPIDTNYAHEHAAYERGYQDATTAMAEKDAEIARLREACKAALEVLPGLEVRSWPPGHEMKRKAIQQLQTALGEAREG